MGSEGSTPFTTPSDESSSNIDKQTFIITIASTSGAIFGFAVVSCIMILLIAAKVYSRSKHDEEKDTQVEVSSKAASSSANTSKQYDNENSQLIPKISIAGRQEGLLKKVEALINSMVQTGSPPVELKIQLLTSANPPSSFAFWQEKPFKDVSKVVFVAIHETREQYVTSDGDSQLGTYVKEAKTCNLDILFILVDERVPEDKMLFHSNLKSIMGNQKELEDLSNQNRFISLNRQDELALNAAQKSAILEWLSAPPRKK